MIGYLSMILGLAVVMYMMIKGWNPIIVGIVAAFVVILMNRLPFSQTMSDSYFVGFTTMVKSLFPAIFSGSLMAQIYNRSGAVVTITDKLGNLLFREGGSPESRYRSAILSMVLVSGLVCYCGMNSLVTLIAVYPIALRILKRAGIPKRFVVGMLTCGVFSFAMTGPGSAEIVNILAMQVLNTSSHVGLCGGILAIIMEIASTTIVLTWMIKRAVARGETFAYGPKDYVADDEAEKPGLAQALIPLGTLFVLFNVFSVDIFAATMITDLMSVVFFRKYIGGREGLFRIINEGVAMTFPPIASVGSIVGFTSIVQTLPEFQALMDRVFNLNVSPVLILLLTVSLIALMTGSSSSAIRIAVPMVSEECMKAGLSAAFIHRVSCFACSVFDTMPWTSGIVITLGIADLDMKDGYPPMFVGTCLSTFLGTMVCVIFMTLFPNLP